MQLARYSSSRVYFRSHYPTSPAPSSPFDCCVQKPPSRISDRSFWAEPIRPITPAASVRTHPRQSVPARALRSRKVQGTPPPPSPSPNPLQNRHSKVDRLLGTVDDCVVGSNQGYYTGIEARVVEPPSSCRSKPSLFVPRPIYAIVRAHKRRQRRRGQRLSRGDEEAGGFDDSEGVWREGNWDNYVRNGRLTRDSRQMKGMVFSGRSDTIIRQPESAATRSPRPPSWDARDLVGQGFQRGSLGGANREVNTGRGYEIGHMADVYDPSDAKGGSVHVAEVSLGIHPAFRTSPPGSSKIERMTGSRLSNGMYEDRPSGSREGSNSGSSGLSYPQLNINIPSTLPDLNTDISPTTTIWSQFSPHSAGGLGGTQLAPPPATAAYPNITALAKVSGSRSSIQTTSFYIRDQSISEHVATQFAPARRESRRERSSAAYSGSSHMRRNSSTRTRKLVPPLSAAFGGFTGLTRYDSKASRASRASSISTFRHGTLEEEEENENVPPLPSPTPKQRRSWSGRSVLLLDEFPKKSAQTTATPLSGSPRIGSYLGSSIPEADGGEDLRRTTSASKVSISSMPSSVSSFNTMYAAGGLSPTPAPRLMQLSPSDRGRSPVSDTRSNKSTIDLEMETRTRNWARERAEGYEQKKARRKREDEEDDEHHQHPARSSFGFL